MKFVFFVIYTNIDIEPPTFTFDFRSFSETIIVPLWILENWCLSEVILCKFTYLHVTWPRGSDSVNGKSQYIVGIFLFIYLWLLWVFVAERGLSLVAVNEGYSSSRCSVFSLWWLLLLQSGVSKLAGFSSCGTWSPDLQLTCLVTSQHVGSSHTREQTHDPCIGRWILNPWTTREVLLVYFGEDLVRLTWIIHINKEEEPRTAPSFWYEQLCGWWSL